MKHIGPNQVLADQLDTDQFVKGDMHKINEHIWNSWTGTRFWFGLPRLPIN